MHPSKNLRSAEDLTDWFRPFSRVVIAFSGGVDSSVVAAAAFRALQTKAVAVTAVSPALASWQRKRALEVARSIGIEHREVDGQELQEPGYRRNDSNRCYFCKQSLYQTLRLISQTHPDQPIVSGTNLDDLSDYRPGIQAGVEASVRTPLADLSLSKSVVRQIAQSWGLPSANDPASPCLASRVAYGTVVDDELLHRIDAAEVILRELGFEVVRVRCQGLDAKVEVEKDMVGRLDALRQQPNVDIHWDEKIRRLGFRSVSIDPEGFRSGKLNDAIVPWPIQKTNP